MSYIFISFGFAAVDRAAMWPAASWEALLLPPFSYYSLLLLQLFRHLPQKTADWQPLRTIYFTPAAADTVRGSAVDCRQIGVINFLIVHVGPVFKPFQIIVQAKVIGNRNMLRTFGYAITAVRTGDSCFLLDDTGRLLKDFQLLCRKRTKIRHVGSIVLHLRHIGHTA